MNKKEIIIRKANLKDASKLLEIYAPYVEKTAITFETEVPTEAEFGERMKMILKDYPYLTAESSGEPVGYAYTGSFVGREAYRHSAETSIYVREDLRGSGIGGALYSALEEISKAQSISNLYACIGYTDVEDDHLTNDSTRFHEHFGYKQTGSFKKCGYKFGTWYDMIWMEKIIGTHDAKPKPFVPFPKFSAEILEKYGVLNI